VLERLQHLQEYYRTRRNVGHTTAMLEGATHTEGVCILSESYAHAQELAALCPGASAMAWYNVGCRRPSTRFPLVIDNRAMVRILTDAIDEITKLQAALAEEDACPF